MTRQYTGKPKLLKEINRIPLLTRRGFNGRVICTRVTAAACEYLLLDSAHIHESDAKYLNYKALRGLMAEMKKSPRTKTVSKKQMNKIKELLKKDNHELNESVINDLMDRYHMHRIRPIYTTEDAEKSLEYFDT